jgi:hypothetical protein
MSIWEMMITGCSKSVRNKNKGKTPLISILITAEMNAVIQKDEEIISYYRRNWTNLLIKTIMMISMIKKI